jgi:uracil-DNA glycosylase family 4
LNRVPNRFPSIAAPYRLAIIGEAPGETEEIRREPFVGTSGRLLQAVLNQHGGMFSAVFCGNVCQFRPPDNNLFNFPWDGVEIQDGIEKLRADIAEFKPNALLLLGGYALRLAGIAPTKELKAPIQAYRGSILKCDDVSSPFYGYKYIPSIHPAAVLRTYEWLPLLAFDVKRALLEAESADYSVPQRTLEIDLTAMEIISRLDAIRGGRIAMDIEGAVEPGKNIQCVSIATSPHSAFIVNPLDFSENEKARIIPALARVLADDNVEKILQNSLYDNFCLTYAWRMPIRNVRFDTMISAAEINCELPKSLAVQTSIFTREPYYKQERKTGDKATYYRYCCRDSAVTYEIAEAHEQVLSEGGKAHRDFNIQLLPAIHYMEQKGMRYDRALAKERLSEVSTEMAETKSRFDSATGLDINPNTNNGANSLANILYKKLGFPPQYKKEKGRKTETLSADAEALLTLARVANRQHIIRDILHWRALEGQRRQLEIGSDADGRIRCGYNLVGTETMRMTCYESPTGSGANLTTIMKKYRDLYVADEGYEMFQIDLSGADSWTVAAHCNRMGDSTLLEDLRFKIKPAKVVALMHLHGLEVGSLPRPDLIGMMHEVPEEGWLYPTCKAVVHGTSYDMQKNTMSKNILLKSWKESGVPQYVDPSKCEALQNLFLRGRYRAIPRWQDWVRFELTRNVGGKPNRRLSSASGHTRIFFGRETDPNTIRAALAHEPQANTTFATNKILHNLWYDPENFTPSGRPIVQPLHQIHDALVGQWPIASRDWARAKLRQWADNAITIAGQEIRISYDGGFGPNWKDTKEKI